MQTLIDESLIVLNRILSAEATGIKTYTPCSAYPSIIALVYHLQVAMICEKFEAKSDHPVCFIDYIVNLLEALDIAHNYFTVYNDFRAMLICLLCEDFSIDDIVTELYEKYFVNMNMHCSDIYRADIYRLSLFV
ncbi:hypothetical protein FACS1894184_06240 [Clostridia bacterium]|nr:hypothetical protein FACS1894184_06240 [Clostridia bacterium]